MKRLKVYYAAIIALAFWLVGGAPATAAEAQPQPSGLSGLESALKELAAALKAASNLRLQSEVTVRVDDSVLLAAATILVGIACWVFVPRTPT